LWRSIFLASRCFKNAFFAHIEQRKIPQKLSDNPKKEATFIRQPLFAFMYHHTSQRQSPSYNRSAILNHRQAEAIGSLKT
jgi:hypothetical protein